MSELTEADFIPLDDFPLVWRWADRWRMPGAPPATATCRPIRGEKARELNERALELHPAPDDGPAEIVIDASGSRSAVCDRLLRLGPPPGEAVVVSWDAVTAVLTRWGEFCLSWDDFCYAGSDDVTVWPESLAWRLAYDRDDAFRYVEWGGWRFT